MKTGLETLILPAGETGAEAAARTLAAGGLVAFPTETVYGLGADAGNASAIAPSLRR
ncbi:tRNA A37 threonylcarbamoyladenosine synthetase subunit TsaC/SUA5/YrdC [Bradyrhizobium sp. GM5.1]